VAGTAAWVAVAQHMGQSGAAAAPSGRLEARARGVAVAYYAALTAPAGAGLPGLAERVAAQVDFYGTGMTRGGLISLQTGYLQRWPDRSFLVRPQSLSASCNSQSAACVVSGLVDYVLRSEPRNQFIAGVDSFSLRVLAAGDAAVITGIGSTVVSRRVGALHGGPR